MPYVAAVVIITVWGCLTPYSSKKTTYWRQAPSVGRWLRRDVCIPGFTLEVEVEDFQELEEALEAGPDVIMLDNFDLEAMARAVVITAGRAKLESSGNVTLDGLRAIADTGVDYISVGALTKDLQAVDLSMRFDAL